MFAAVEFKKHAHRACFLLCAGIASLLFSVSVSAGDAADIGAKQASISIIIDDIGYRLKEGEQIIKLAGALTYAVIPHTPYTKFLANLANKQGKEVMVHLPMQAEVEMPIEQGVLTMEMTHVEFIKAFNSSIKDVPHAIGINNHQGSLLTRHPGYMTWVMMEIKKARGLFFIDSRTSKKSVAEQVAREHQVPVLHRDVFLDNERNKEAIKGQFNRLVQLAIQRGTAIGIGHPYPETLDVLREMLPRLNELGVRLIPVSSQFQRQPPKKALVRVSGF